MFIAKMFIYKDETKTETTAIKKTFMNFSAAVSWIQGNTDCNAAGGSIMDADTWGVVFEIDRQGQHQDYRR